MQQISKQPAFELGQIVATPGALAALKKAGQQPGEFLTRRVHGEGRKAGELLTRRNGRTTLRCHELSKGLRSPIRTEWWK